MTDKEYTVDIEDRTYYEFEVTDEGKETALVTCSNPGIHHDEVIGPNQLEMPEEFEDFKQVMVPGAKKHGPNSWLLPNGGKSSFKQMHFSALHHLVDSYLQGTENRGDEESGLDPLLHLTTRSQMMYTRIQRGIKHKDDTGSFNAYDLIDELTRFLQEKGYIGGSE